MFLDQYHLNLIKELSRIYPSSNFLKDKIFLVEDSINSLKLISEDAYVLLYNLSIYLESNPRNFYKPNSKILNFNRLNSSDEKDLEEIIQSYEVSLTRNIEEFFKINF